MGFTPPNSGGGGTVTAVTASAPIASSGGATPNLTLNNAGVTYAKIQNVSGTDRVLGRSSLGAGSVEEITCTAAGRAILDDASNVDQRTTLGLGTMATAASADYLPLAGGTLTGEVNLGENAGLVLDAALSADGKYSGIVEAGTAGEALSFGHLVYFKAADSRWWKTDANADSTAGNVRIGIVVLAAGAGGDATKILHYGKIRADALFPVLTIGASVYISETAGEIVVTQPVTADVIIRKIGFACTADVLFFNPSNDYIVHI